ncbi:uncharacterized protein LOC109602888 [Aethina tumida]|uniref:uncharacterized protein LOC109602888 n=1 Tax=Aethina tumida TaxID=116153 RepID=UPI002147F0C2|nr:uncharacterized protein LOC109602888 [Aethina tumida]
MEFKTLIVFSVLLVTTFGAVSKQRSDVHNIDLCGGSPSTLVYQTVITEEGKLLQTVRQTVNWPNGGIINSSPIQCIYVEDLIGDGNGGYPTIKSGGIGSTSVTIELVSQWTKGMSFSITIYT